jgi:hypothetical protein
MLAADFMKLSGGAHIRTDHRSAVLKDADLSEVDASKATL